MKTIMAKPIRYPCNMAIKFSGFDMVTSVLTKVCLIHYNDIPRNAFNCGYAKDIMKNTLLALALIGGFGFFQSCNPDEETPERTFTYEQDAKGIFDANCATAGCHASGSPVGSLANYADAKAMAENGRILGAIKHESGFSPMPKGQAKMSDEDIASIEQWIVDGLEEK
jgi:mono/diheme cytochrome c family protein